MDWFRVPNAGSLIEQFSKVISMTSGLSIGRIRNIPIMQAVVCDLPLPCTPQTKAENGIFAFNIILQSGNSFPPTIFPSSIH